MSDELPLCRQADVNAMIAATGLTPCQPVSANMLGPIETLREQASAFNEPVLLSFFAQEVTGFLPARLQAAQILYVCLPKSMAHVVPRLLRACWDCYGELTDHPWHPAVYLELQDPGLRSAGDHQLLSFRTDAVDLSRAFALGYAILMVECDGVVHGRGILFDEDLASAISACENSTFQRPLRQYSLRVLQERTRAVEETGFDPEGAPNGGRAVTPVLCSPGAARKPFDLSRVPEHKRSRLPMVAWHRMRSAVIGELKELTYFPQEAAGEAELVLKVPVTAEMYERILGGAFTAQVHALRRESGCSAYVLLVESDDEVRAVCMRTCHARFQSAYEHWERGGAAEMVFENFHNGRFHRVRLPWPSMGGARSSCRGCCAALDDFQVGEALVQASASAAAKRLTCYISAGTDAAGWRIESE